MATIASKQDSYYWSHLWTNLKPFVTLYCLKAVFNKHYFILIESRLSIVHLNPLGQTNNVKKVKKKKRCSKASNGLSTN